jgi:hypothetical protein
MSVLVESCTMSIPSSCSTHVVSLAMSLTKLLIQDFSVDFTLYDSFLLDYVFTLYYYGYRGVSYGLISSLCVEECTISFLLGEALTLFIYSTCVVNNTTKFSESHGVSMCAWSTIATKKS